MLLGARVSCASSPVCDRIRRPFTILSPVHPKRSISVLSRLCNARSSGIGVARIFIVMALALVLLAGLIPPGALSAARICKMACCAGKPLHEAGACKAVLPSAGPNEATPETDADEHAAHDGMQMASAPAERVVETITPTGHSQTAQPSSTQHPAPRRARAEQASLTAQAFTTPCSAECAVAALALRQVRRPRESAALSIAITPRPPTVIARTDAINILRPSSAERRRQSRPRAPPVSLVNPA